MVSGLAMHGIKDKATIIAAGELLRGTCPKLAKITDMDARVERVLVILASEEHPPAQA